jgi:hypothetical protein
MLVEHGQNAFDVPLDAAFANVPLERGICGANAET